jgi:hypothetical protein
MTRCSSSSSKEGLLAVAAIRQQQDLQAPSVAMQHWQQPVVTGKQGRSRKVQHQLWGAAHTTFTQLTAAARQQAAAVGSACYTVLLLLLMAAAVEVAGRLLQVLLV